MDLKKIPGSQVVVTVVSAAAAFGSAVMDAIANTLDEVARLLHPCPPAPASRGTAISDGTTSTPFSTPSPASTVPEEQSFYFRRSWDTATGAVAGNLQQLEQGLRASDADVISHHSWTGDFSRWVADVLGDRPLADALAVIESDVRTGVIDGNTGRERLLGTLRSQLAH
jgi:Family of unknown function (DUF5752)